MGFCQWPEMAQKWVLGAKVGAKVGEHGSKPTFTHFGQSWEIGQNPLLTHPKGGGNCFPKRALGQP